MPSKTTTTKTTTPTTPADIARITAMFNQLETLVADLAGRWIDESAYENIDDYSTSIQRVLPEGFTLEKMTKRPFGFVFSIGTPAKYAITCTMRSYAWKRIG